MKENRAIDVVLKNVRVLYAHLNKPQKYMGDPTSDERYSVSFLVEKGGDNFKAFVEAVKLASKGKAAERVKKLLLQKIKPVPAKAAEYIEDYHDGMRMINLSSKQPAKLYDFSKTSKSNKASADVKIFSSDTIHIKIVLNYIDKYNVLGTWPNKVCLVEKGGYYGEDKEDKEWNKLHQGSTEDDFEEDSEEKEEKEEDFDFEEEEEEKPKKKTKKKEEVNVEDEEFEI